ncbi:MAG: sugar phosphate isomerase/epimerase [Rhodothermaceae bacterium]|nr:sugar phosphate isomerase/epimerase [Bacteroidota bacterium]MXW15459.1 sugar phosphate isomerase/epimerase [Rhodothermaceae bacterium]MDE2645192.1 sugar phosphate isomerase/epimerase [Bacteroidota bacterium]MXW32113.1 sugar phosphate isomerase/epimerase [Rhodothermaceae bacterium]MXX96944.1 sugar phosphate isomerase/epimerase [Rhodothermaceae bacterium]
MNRRTFLQSSVALPAAVGALAGFSSGKLPEPQGSKALARPRSLERIGVQLYTVRHLMSSDYEGTIRAVADAGYDEVETVWDADRNPDDIRALFDEVGLAAPSGHVPLGALQDDLTKVLDASKRIGHSYIVCPWLDEDQRTMAHYRKYVPFFNEVGAACKESGIQFAYHNHEFEFEPAEDGIIPYDFMLAELDPDLVKMELDLYWIAYANRDPVEYFQNYPGHFPLCHIKDMGADREMTPVGEGQIDFTAILAESETAGLKHYFVEHDHPGDALASIRTSIAHLRSLEF